MNNLDLKIKKSFESIIPDENKKEELFNTILLKAEENNRRSVFDFLNFKYIFPAAALVCLLFVGFIGIRSGILDNFIISKDNLSTEATAFEPAMGYDLTTDSAYSLDVCDEAETAAEIPQDAPETEDDKTETALAYSAVIFTANEKNGDLESNFVTLYSLDPLALWEEIKLIYPETENVMLVSYSFINNELNIYFEASTKLELHENDITAIAKSFVSTFEGYEINAYIKSATTNRENEIYNLNEIVKKADS